MDIMSMPLSAERIKSQVKVLRRHLEQDGAAISQARALETVAHMYGHKDWNTLKAALDKLANGKTSGSDDKIAVNTGPARPRLVPGDSVQGTYLGQAISGTVFSSELHRKPGYVRLVVELDKPVDVVKFDSFSNMRRRISGVISPVGRTDEVTSDGMPHLDIRLAG